MPPSAPRAPGGWCVAPKMETQDIVAGIVAFRPEADHLLRLAKLARQEAGHVIVFANSALPEPLEGGLKQCGAEIITSPCNLGVAEALNMIALAAVLRGARRVLLLDQDALWKRGALAALTQTMDALAGAGVDIALLGPRIVAPSDGGGYVAPRYFGVNEAPQRPGARAVRYLITSGSLIDLKAWRRVGAFRSDFFIDMIDVEWCFRAWRAGYSCWCAEDVAIEHRVGQGDVRALGMRATRQPQFRFRAYVRNLAHCLTLSHVPWGWKLRFAANIARLGLVYQFSVEPRLYRWIWHEIADGLAGRLGPPHGAELTKALY